MQKKKKKVRHWRDLSPRQRVGAIVGASVQFALAAAAWRDLAARPAALVNGPKVVWALVIGVNFIGPLAYFAGGRRTRGRLG
ncbi:hypothetical protein [Cryobacterium sp. TMT1-21]|uniref:hypothetical protein n=1 Tax=Cryobacterium sp. TMT1-21 TaxID=1259234 RepID=UPI00141ACC7B|nr:hypothetical protein [Cryobacterium sp. TMT1-21]